MLSIDELESVLKFDLFPALYIDHTEENRLESNYEMKEWPIDARRYQRRVEQWNKQ